MKKNWMQGLSLALSVVLLIVAAAEWTALNGLRTELAESRQEADALEERLAEAETSLEEAEISLEAAWTDLNKPVPSIHFSNASLNTRDRMLTVDVCLELPDIEEYSVNIGLCRVGEPYRAAWNVFFLHRQEDGSYANTVTFYLDLDEGIEIRMEDNTILYSSDTMKTLLPVQPQYGRGSFHYSFSLQQFSLQDCIPILTDLEGQEIQVADGVCRLYRNGKLVAENREEDPIFSVPCAPGDHMRICYACTDEFGLRYEFPLREWVAQRWEDAVSYPISHCPTVIWPE